jgi:RNA polymerase sigma-70 factor (ECF subfamily)
MLDRQLIERALQGDRDAFEAIVAAHQSAVFGYLRARLFQPNDAEDLTQEVFLRFYLTRARFDSENLVRPWLLGIARNLLKEHARKQKRRKEVAWTELCLELDDMLRPGAEEGSDGTYEDVLAHLPGCMESLGPSARNAIDLRYRANLRLSDIGKKLHRSEGAVKLLMYRARQALKHCLNTRLNQPK